MHIRQVNTEPPRRVTSSFTCLPDISDDARTSNFGRVNSCRVTMLNVRRILTPERVDQVSESLPRCEVRHRWTYSVGNRHLRVSIDKLDRVIGTGCFELFAISLV
jgi:hypothetical protein